ncbi:MAG: AAA family ATPase [Sulfurovum sp.]|nr:AAA family ATPase [Sulfurovum sp.]
MFTREELEKRIEESREEPSIHRVAKETEVEYLPMHYVSKGFTGYIKVSGKAYKILSTVDELSYVVIVGFDGNEWFVSVGNKYIEGSIAQEEAELIVAQTATSQVESMEIRGLYGVYGGQQYMPSSHWRDWWSKNKLPKEVNDTIRNLDDRTLDAIENHFYGQTEKEENEEEKIAARMNLYAFKRHLLFIGEKGSGKTHDIYAYMKANNLDHVFVGGNADVEAMDLKGNLLPFEKNGEKNFIWVDGPLTQAFRRAAAGEKVILFIDELLRMSKSAQSLLVPALTTDIHGNYVLDTGRVIDVVDGVGKTECIKAPSQNLWVLATTNMGAEYGTPDMESALEERFELIEKNNSLDKIIRVLKEIAKTKGFDDEVVSQMTDFYESMVALKEEGVLAKLINLRHLAQSMEDAMSQDDLYDCLMDRMPKWVERDMGGKLLEDQIVVVEKALKKAGIR